MGQDRFWRQPVLVTTTSGTQLYSQEAVQCTDNLAFCEAIKKAQQTSDIVIAEGFQLLHEPKVVSLITHIFFLQLNKSEAKRRRLQPQSNVYNPNPATVGRKN